MNPDEQTQLTVDQLERQFMDGTLHPNCCFQLIRLLIEKNRDQDEALKQMRFFLGDTPLFEDIVKELQQRSASPTAETPAAYCQSAPPAYRTPPEPPDSAAAQSSH